ncbi:MAG: DUF4396 domain-containing protein [Proteobacteria bacterium]|nr:DUF4396 domain-containing protein [Pseudomonadota bacterium]
MHLHSPTLMTSAQATVHCLTGCVIGEVAGLLIGVALGLDVWLILTLATALAYLSGFTLGVAPLMRRERLGFLTGLRVIWVGEVISIGVMEIMMAMGHSSLTTTQSYLRSIGATEVVDTTRKRSW